MKYIIVQWEDGLDSGGLIHCPIIFSDFLKHADLNKGIPKYKIRSAGFCAFQNLNLVAATEVTGFSDSLSLAPVAEDAAILTTFLTNERRLMRFRV